MQPITFSRHLHRDSVAAVGDAVVFVEVDEGGVEVGEFVLVEDGVGRDDHAITGVGLVGGGAVYGDDAGVVLCADGIGGEALAVGDVVDVDLLVFVDTRRLQQLAVNGA